MGDLATDLQEEEIDHEALLIPRLANGGPEQKKKAKEKRRTPNRSVGLQGNGFGGLLLSSPFELGVIDSDPASLVKLCRFRPSRILAHLEQEFEVSTMFKGSQVE